MNLPYVRKKVGNGSTSRYLGQLCAIRDYVRWGARQAVIDICDTPAVMVDEILTGEFRALILLKDIAKFEDFHLVEGENIDDAEVESWYEREWVQIDRSQMVVDAVDRFGGKQEFAELVGISYNTINNWYSFRTMIDSDIGAVFKSCSHIEDADDYATTFRARL